MSAPSASAPPALAVERLNAWYGAAQVLYDVAFTVERGEVVALMGQERRRKIDNHEGLASIGVPLTSKKTAWSNG